MSRQRNTFFAGKTRWGRGSVAVGLTLAFAVLLNPPVRLAQAAEEPTAHEAEGEGGKAAPAAKPLASAHEAAPGSNTTLVSGTSLAALPPAKEGCPLCPVSNKEEVQVLMQLRERHTLLTARENMVAQKEAALVKLEESLDAQLTKYDVAMSRIEARLDIGDAQKEKRNAQLKALIETLQGLSAKKAAPMLAEADADFVAEIFKQLGSARVASLLAVMPAAKAGKLIDLSVDAVPKPARAKKAAAKAEASPAPAAPATDAPKPGEKP